MRLRAVITTLNNFVVENDEAGFAKFAFLVDALTDEVIEELEDKDEEAIEAFMEAMGQVISWIGHGDDNRLPESMRVFATKLQPVEA